MNYENVNFIHTEQIEKNELDIFCLRYQRLVDRLETYRENQNDVYDEIIPDECWLLATVVVDDIEIGLVEITVEDATVTARYRRPVTYVGFLFEGVVYGIEYSTARHNDFLLSEDDDDDYDDDVPNIIPLHLGEKELMVEFFEFLDDYYEIRN